MLQALPGFWSSLNPKFQQVHESIRSSLTKTKPLLQPFSYPSLKRNISSASIFSMNSLKLLSFDLTMIFFNFRFHAITLNFKSSFKSTSRDAEVEVEDVLKQVYRVLSLDDYEEFESEWKNLSASHGNMACFSRVYNHRLQLASCYTGNSMTLGVESTQRSENQHQVPTVCLESMYICSLQRYLNRLSSTI